MQPILLILNSDKIIIIIIIIKNGCQSKAGRERLTPNHPEDPSPTIPTHRKKEEKGKQDDKNGASSIGQQKSF